ncbi:putative malic acid transport protein [Aspergillus ruber CBS 135680]|uniref:Sulfite efflux pump SSU1 n=1 Tax=Aspergillus ruber (strain CBS 135680) TaxID=1388766 RepID=A0A017SF02_ASPRC|nr:uncharacterized protein EURHEDRAFT_530994 [Aspergillus ruber CBS 135680]EYE95214.1 hypothetical protein EURHEDRAFT_530994 [Aspergillus ruber CBS 135680]
MADHAHDSSQSSREHHENGVDKSHEQETTRLPFHPASRALWNFSTQWFLVPQGTGIIALILHQLNYQFSGIEVISVVIWIYTIILLALCLFAYLLRVILYPRHVARVLRTSIVETACLASVPITFTSIIQMTTLVLVHSWGKAWAIVSFVLWWINTGLVLVAVMVIPYVFVKVQPPGVKAILPCVLLPLISALTSAAGGGVLCVYGQISPRLQVPIIIVSYLEIGLALPMALGLSEIFATRLFDRSFPKLEQIYQDMILCGPFGQGSFAFQVLGQAVLKGAFAEYNRGTFLTAQATQPVAFASHFAGLLSWGYGTFWWCFAIISIVHTFISQPGGIRGSHFTMSAWALVFPWGVYTNGAVQLGRIMDAPAFKVWSTTLFILILVICIALHIFTIKGLITGKVLGLAHGWRKGAYRDDIGDKDV